MKIHLIILLAFIWASCNGTNNKKLPNEIETDSVKPSTEDTSIITPKSTVSKKDTLGIHALKKIFHVDTIRWSVIPPKPYFFHGKSATLIAETFRVDTSINTEGSFNNLSYRGYVCLTEMDFRGDDIPFICTVSDNVKSLYLNRKRIRFKPNEEFFFRQHINLYLGYNRIPIKITNKRNETLETYLEMNMVPVN